MTACLWNKLLVDWNISKIALYIIDCPVLGITVLNDKLPPWISSDFSVLGNTVSVLGREEGYTVKYTPAPEGHPKGNRPSYIYILKCFRKTVCKKKNSVQPFS